MKVNKEVVERAWKEILQEGLGLDIDEHLYDTPKRIAKFYEEFFEKKRTAFTDFLEEDYGGMVIIRSEGFSICSHHFLPFRYDCYVGYIPKKRIIGASKIPRVVDMFARRPQVQERLTEQIVDYIFSHFAVEGVMVSMIGEHLCMIMRGVKKQNSKMVTSSFRGNFENQTVRNEFFNLIKLWECR